MSPASLSNWHPASLGTTCLQPQGMDCFADGPAIKWRQTVCKLEKIVNYAKQQYQ